MFENWIRLLPPFTEEAVAKYYTTNSSVADKTLAMTMAILFYKRLPDFKIQTKFCTGVSLSFLAAQSYDPSKFNFVFVSGYHKPDDELSGDFVSFVNHEKFFEEKLNRKIYVRLRKDWNTLFVVSSTIDASVIHAVQTFIPVFFSDFFKEMPRTEEETKLLSSLQMRTDVIYKKEIQNFCDTHEDFKSFLLRKQLIGFEHTLWKRKADNAFEDLQSIKSTISCLLEDYKTAIRKKNEKEIIYRGLLAAENDISVDTDFEEYLCSNKNLTNITVSEDLIKFVVKTFALPYLPDSWEILSNRGAIFQGYLRVGNCLDEPDNRKLLLDAIFGRNHNLKLRMCARFIINYSGESVNSQVGYNFEAENPNLRDYIPNPHLDRHNCFGQNKADILENMFTGDMIGAIEACINTAKRVNVDEVSPTFIPFVQDLIGFRGKCIVTPDGKELTPTQAVVWLKGEMNETVSDGTGEDHAA